MGNKINSEFRNFLIGSCFFMGMCIVLGGIILLLKEPNNALAIEGLAGIISIMVGILDIVVCAVYAYRKRKLNEKN